MRVWCLLLNPYKHLAHISTTGGLAAVAILGVFRKTLAIVENKARALRDKQRPMWSSGRCHP